MKCFFVATGLSLAVLALPTPAFCQQNLPQVSSQDTTSFVYEAILENLKTYSNVPRRERLLDRRVLQWWQSDANIGREPARFIGKHDSEMMDGFREKGLIDGYAAPERRTDFQPENWLCQGDERKVTISLSTYRVTGDNGVDVLCWIDTVIDSRLSGGRRYGFFALLQFTLEYNEGIWEVVRLKHILLT